MQCPKCMYSRTERDALVPDWQCPKCGIVYSKFKSSSDARVTITMSSGEKIVFSEIKLYDASEVYRLQELRRAIEKNFGGFSTGIGFIGSLDYVIEGSLVTGAIEGLVSGAMAATGTKQLVEAKDLYKNIRRNAVFVSVDVIENIEFPETEMWKAPSFKVSTRKEMIQMPSKYITVRSEDKELNVFWEKVEQYLYS